VIVSRLDEDRLELLRVARTAQAAASRSRRVATSRRRDEPVPVAQYEPSVDVTEDVIVDPMIEVEELEADEAEKHDGTMNEEEVGEANEDETVSDDTTEETN